MLKRCEASLTKDFLRSREPDRENRCRRNADYLIEGNCFCTEHTSLRLLEQAREAGVITDLVKKAAPAA